MRKNVEVIRGYAKGLSDARLHELNDKLSQNFMNDFADCLKILQNCADVDKWLCSARTVAQFFELIDLLHSQLDVEVKRRNTVSIG